MNRLAASSWLFSLASVWLSLGVVVGFDVSPSASDVGAALDRIAARPGAHVVELLLDTMSGLSLVVAAVPIHRVLGRLKPAGVMTGATLIAASGLLQAAHNMENLALTQISSAYVATSGSERQAWLITGEAAILTARWGVSIFSATLLVGVLILAQVVWERTRARALGAAGMVTTVVGLVAVVVTRISADYESVGYALVVPFLAWQIWFGIWLWRSSGGPRPS